MLSMISIFHNLLKAGGKQVRYSSHIDWRSIELSSCDLSPFNVQERCRDSLLKCGLFMLVYVKQICI